MNALKAIAVFFYEVFNSIFGPLIGALKQAAASRGNAERRFSVAIVAVIVIIASVVSLVLTQCSSAPKLVTAPFVAVGQVLAKETSKLLGNKGSVVLIVPALGTTGSKSPMAIEMQSFQKELKSSGGVNVVATETITTP